MEFEVLDDEVFYHAVDLTLPPWSDSGVYMRQDGSGPGPGPKPDDANNDDAEGQDDEPMNAKEQKTSETDLGALETDMLEYQFSENDVSGEVHGPQVLMTPSSIMSPMKDAPASLSRASFIQTSRNYEQKCMSPLEGGELTKL